MMTATTRAVQGTVERNRLRQNRSAIVFGAIVVAVVLCTGSRGSDSGQRTAQKLVACTLCVVVALVDPDSSARDRDDNDANNGRRAHGELAEHRNLGFGVL